MSSIGSTSVAGLGLAGSIVGSSHPEAVRNQEKAASAQQKARVDQKNLLAQALDDVADPEFGTDRDADGRLLYRRSVPAGESATSEPMPNSDAVSARPADALGESGKSLDIEV
jgi:hypothetical protein